MSTILGLIMKVCAYHGPGSFAIEERPVPEISDEEILVKTSIVGICGTDVHKAAHQTVPSGTVLGHELSGVVDKVGSAVTKFRVGDRVAVQHHAPCMSCKACLKGHHSLCDQYLKTNIKPGGFSEYIRIMPENVKHTVRLMPDHINFIEGAFMEPLSCCLRGFDRLHAVPGDNYLIIGMGPIGMLFSEIARAFNAGTVTGIDIDPYRIDFARNTLNVNFTFNPKTGTWGDFKREHKVPNFDHVIITVGNGAVYQGALDHVSHGTNVLVFAECPPNQEIIIDPNLIYRNELNIMGSYSSSPRFLTMAMDMISSRALDVKPLVTHILPPERIDEGIELAKNAKNSLKVMIKF
ncbi:MAG: alcohol dehydrogenase catalytic domain-containing protein [Promethearchaeota archaeon]